MLKQDWACKDCMDHNRRNKDGTLPPGYVTGNNDGATDTRQWTCRRCKTRTPLRVAAVYADKFFREREKANA